MKPVIRFLLACVAGVAATVSLGAEAAKEAQTAAATPGLKGTLYRIDGNKHPAAKVTCHPHDRVEIDWTYPITPASLPSKADQRSSDPAVVKATGIRRVIHVAGPLGTGELGGFFVAEKVGHAELTFTITHRKAQTVLKCDVEVK